MAKVAAKHSSPLAGSAQYRRMLESASGLWSLRQKHDRQHRNRARSKKSCVNGSNPALKLSACLINATPLRFFFRSR
jgi:hypothetical protein